MKKVWLGVAGLLGLAFLLCLGASHETRAAATTQSIAFPMYEYPTIGTLWSDVNAAGSQVPFIIADPASGPGASVDPNYTTAISNSVAAGQRTIGYVYTNYQARAIADVLTDVDSWYQMYPSISGIFVDLIQNGSAGDLCYAATVHNYIKSRHPSHLVVMNPGTNIEARYEPYSDIFLNAENTYAVYSSAWTPLTDGFENNAANANRFWHVIHTTSSGQMASALSLTRANNAGWVLLTDGTLPNPYMAVPSYWSTFLTSVASLPQTAIPNRGLTSLPAGCLDLSMQTSSQNASVTRQVNTTITNTVTNTDSTRTSWPSTTITYTVPAGVSLSNLSAGAGWSCSTGTGVCSYNNSIAAGASPPTVTATLAVSCQYQSGNATATLQNFANNKATASVGLTKPGDCTTSSSSSNKKTTTTASSDASVPPNASSETVTTTVTTSNQEVTTSFPPSPKSANQATVSPTTNITPIVIGGSIVAAVLGLIGFIIWRRRHRHVMM